MSEKTAHRSSGNPFERGLISLLIPAVLLGGSLVLLFDSETIQTHPIAVALLTLLVVPAMLLGVFLLGREKIRSARMQNFAYEMRLAYRPEGDRLPFETAPLAEASIDLPGLFVHEYAGRHGLRNMIHGAVSGVQLALFDYRLLRGRKGRTRDAGDRTVLLFHAGDLNLPDFVLTPLSGLAQPPPSLLEIPARPAFCLQWALQGSDNRRLRVIFNDELLAFLAGVEDWTVEAFGGMLACYRNGRIATSRLFGSLEQGMAIFREMRKAAVKSGIYRFHPINLKKPPSGLLRQIHSPFPDEQPS